MRFAAARKPSCGMWGHRNGPNQVFIGGDVPIEALATSSAISLAVCGSSTRQA
jgi:hypothetical protein